VARAADRADTVSSVIALQNESTIHRRHARVKWRVTACKVRYAHGCSTSFNAWQGKVSECDWAPTVIKLMAQSGLMDGEMFGCKVL